MTFRFFDALKYPAIHELIRTCRSRSPVSNSLQVTRDRSMTSALAGDVGTSAKASVTAIAEIVDFTFISRCRGHCPAVERSSPAMTVWVGLVVHLALTFATFRLYAFRSIQT